MALTTAFAKNGNKKAVPQTTADGSVSYDQGFGNLYALPPEEGGLFIDRAQFNQIMFDTTSAVISNQNSITTLNSKVTANQNSINTLNSKVADLESGVSTGVVNLTGNQTIAGIKTFSSPVVVPNATANTHAVNLAQLNTKANQATTYTKTEVNNLVNAKANANATVNLTGNQTVAGNKTLSGATTFNGAIVSKGANTFSGNNTFNTGQVTFNNNAPISNTAPTNSNHLTTKKYVDELKTNLETTLNSVVSDTFEPFYQIKNNPYGLKEIVLGKGGDTTDPAEAVRMGMKYKAFRITIKGEVTGNLSIATPAIYAGVVFYYDSNSGTTGILNGNLSVSNCKCRIIRLNLNNGVFVVDRNAYVSILSSMNITAPSDKAALNISGSIVFSDQTTNYPPRPWVLNSNVYGISLDNYGRFIAGRNLQIQTTNTTYKVFCNRGSIATMTGTKLSGDGTNFNIALNTPTANGLILR